MDVQLGFRGQIINDEQYSFITRLDNAPTAEARNHVIRADENMVSGLFSPYCSKDR